MKRLERPAAPECINDSEASRQNKKKYYGKDNPWADFPQGSKVMIRERLLEMSEQECAYCGKRLYSNDADMHVEHFLPQSVFPFLSLCWENLLPLCSDCNTKKSSFSPKSLENKPVAEAFLLTCLEKCSEHRAYDKDALLENCKDRMIDPSYDDPQKHIKFDAGSGQYSPDSEIGKIMTDTFFRRKKSFDKRLRNLKDLVETIIKNEDEPLNCVKRHISISGYSFIVMAFYAYWMNEYQAKQSQLKP